MHRLSRRIPAPPSTYSSSSSHEPQLSTGVSFANMPVSQQAISMAFQVLDKDEDGRINRSVEAAMLCSAQHGVLGHVPRQLGCLSTTAHIWSVIVAGTHPALLGTQ